MAMSVTYTTFLGEIVYENRGGVERTYVADTLGSTAKLVDASGNITDTWTYWPFGEVQTRTGTTQTRFAFCGVLGYLQDLVNNFWYVRFRFFRSRIIRWQTLDALWPIELAYAYCKQSPSNWVDPSGLNVLATTLSGALGGCLINSAVTFIGNLFSGGEPDHDFYCKLGVQCLSGAVAGAGAGITLGTLGAAAALGCILGELAAAINAIGTRKCTGTPPCSPLSADDICGIIGDALGGCATGAAIGRLGGLARSGPVFSNPEPGSPIFDPVGAFVGGLISLIANRFGAVCSSLPGVAG